MSRKILVNSNCYHGYSIEDAIEGISNAGFKYIELTATKGWTEHVFFDQSFERLLEVRDLLEEKGLIPLALSGHTSLMDLNRSDDFIKNIYLAHFFGCEYIVTSVGEAHLEDVDSLGKDVILENLRTFEPVLRDCDLTMVIEVHGEDYGSGRVLKELIEPLKSDVIFIAYDTANAIFYGDVDPVEDLEDSIDLVRYVHIKDKDGKRDEWNFPALGEGYVEFKKIISVLDRYENLSPLSIEIEFTENGPDSLDEVNKAVKNSKIYLESLGLEVI